MKKHHKLQPRRPSSRCALPLPATAPRKTCSGLAVADTIVLLATLFIIFLPTLCAFAVIRLPCPLIYYMIPWSYFIGLTAQTCSTYLTVAVTLERYIAVCYPLRSRYWWSPEKAKLCVFIVTVFAIIYNIPRPMEVIHSTVLHEDGNRCIPGMMVETELRQHPVYVSVYITWMYFIVMYIGPLLTLAWLNFKIYRQIGQSMKVRSTLTRNQEKEIKLTIMLFGVVIVFCLCNLLSLINNVLEWFEIEEQGLLGTGDIPVTINSSVNVIFYCIFGAKFRRMIMVYLGLGCLCKKDADFHRVNTVYRSQSKRSEITVVCLLPEETCV
ncbi:hypothetical protein QYM36_017449 [Artemia franciscana]|uniref:G-protein coupled receptors family 1 profile domain-containing protein n=1 Tax=Artemia franciscana TaxID=6661 RepID=A0AA88HGW7_ARTSF|nr:hypothetical protein QYM36_017449 [Artemia franciscana]